MKRFNKIFAVCLTLSVFGGSLLPSPWTCGGFTEPVPIEVHADGEPTTIDSGIGVLITMLLANGIRFVGNFDDTVKPGIQKLWNDFTTATGNTVTLATLGAESVLSLGYLRTSSTVNNAVNAFQQWYTGAFSVPATGSVSIPVATGSGTYVPISGCVKVDANSETSTDNQIWYHTDREVNVVAYYSDEAKTRVQRGMISTEPFNYYSGNKESSCTAALQAARAYVYDEITYYFAGGGNLPVRGFHIYPINPYRSGDSGRNMIYYVYGEGASIGDISMTGQSLDLIDGYDISGDQAKLLDIAGIQDLVGTLGLTLDNITDLVDSIPLIMDYPWADTFPDDPAFADTPDDAIPWVDVPDAVIPAEVPEYVPETPADEGSYKVLGLERVFPFSIPFDLIAVVNLLNAEPVCPEFTFRVYNPISGQNIDAQMSFERFEGVAQVIRIVETLGFIVFLILITRSLIRS